MYGAGGKIVSFNMQQTFFAQCSSVGSFLLAADGVTGFAGFRFGV